MNRALPPAPRALPTGAVRRGLCALVAIGGAAAIAAHPAGAPGYPSKPVRLLVASSAGSNPDTVARVVAGALALALGQQVVVDNRAGAGGNIGAEVAARAPADGHTVFLAHTNHSINATLYRRLAYDLVRDFAPVSLLALSPFVAAVHPSLPVKSLRELVRLARARPGELSFASAGTGSGTHFAAEYFNGMAGVRMLHVAYKGGGPALAAVLAGETAVYFSPIATGRPHMRSGKLRALGVSTAKRLPDMPELPAIAETLPGYEMLAWAGLMVPAKVPPAVVAALHKAAVAALARPEVAARLKELGFIAVGNRPEEMDAYVRGEIVKYAEIIRRLGLSAQS